jgi:hypothetical protein
MAATWDFKLTGSKHQERKIIFMPTLCNHSPAPSGRPVAVGVL